MSGMGRTIVLSPALGVERGLNSERAALPVSSALGLYRIGAELLRVTGGEVPTGIHYPRSQEYREAARIVVSSSGLDGRVPFVGREVPDQADIIGARDHAYDAIRDGGDGVQILFVLPDVARVMLCGNTGLNREQADSIVSSGIVAMGFKSTRETYRNEGGMGRILAETPRSRLVMTSFSQDPTEFSLSE